jgi:hypothetical protein
MNGVFPFGGEIGFKTPSFVGLSGSSRPCGAGYSQ